MGKALTLNRSLGHVTLSLPHRPTHYQERTHRSLQVTTLLKVEASQDSPHIQGSSFAFPSSKKSGHSSRCRPVSPAGQQPCHLVTDETVFLIQTDTAPWSYYVPGFVLGTWVVRQGACLPEKAVLGEARPLLSLAAWCSGGVGKPSRPASRPRLEKLRVGRFQPRHCSES